MAATKNLLDYETIAQVTCGIASLAYGSCRESNVVDNSANKYQDDYVTLTFTIASGVLSVAPVVNIYAAGSMGTVFPKIELATGVPVQTGGGDAAVAALAAPNNLRLVGAFALQTTSSSGERTFTTEPMSVAQAFGGALPLKYSLIIENQTGVAFSSSTPTTAAYLEHAPLDTTSGN